MVKFFTLAVFLMAPLFGQEQPPTQDENIAVLRETLKLVTDDKLAGDLLNGPIFMVNKQSVKYFLFFSPQNNYYHVCKLDEPKWNSAIPISISLINSVFKYNWIGEITLNDLDIISFDPRNSGWNALPLPGDLEINCNPFLPSTVKHFIGQEYFLPVDLLKSLLLVKLAPFKPSIDFTEYTRNFAINLRLPAEYPSMDEYNAVISTYRKYRDNLSNRIISIINNLQFLEENNIIGPTKHNLGTDLTLINTISQYILEE